MSLPNKKWYFILKLDINEGVKIISNLEKYNTSNLMEMLLTGVAEALRARLSVAFHHHIILFTKTTAAQNEVAHSYDRVRGYVFWQLFLWHL